MKHELVLRRMLFTFGIILEISSLAMLGVEIYHTVTMDFASYLDHIPTLINYTIMQYATIIFKIIISAYAIYGLHHIDEVINPLFTFTVLYAIFVVFQTLTFFVEGGLNDFSLISSVNTLVDIVVASIFLIVTLIFKIDDWRPYKRG